MRVRESELLLIERVNWVMKEEDHNWLSLRKQMWERKKERKKWGVRRDGEVDDDNSEIEVAVAELN